jgi:hypothetical protein
LVVVGQVCIEWLLLVARSEGGTVAVNVALLLLLLRLFLLLGLSFVRQSGKQPGRCCTLRAAAATTCTATTLSGLPNATTNKQTRTLLPFRNERRDATRSATGGGEGRSRTGTGVSSKLSKATVLTFSYCVQTVSFNVVPVLKDNFPRSDHVSRTQRSFPALRPHFPSYPSFPTLRPHFPPKTCFSHKANAYRYSTLSRLNCSRPTQHVSKIDNQLTMLAFPCLFAASFEARQTRG